MSDDLSEESRKLYEELHKAIENYLISVFKDSENDEAGDYVAQWVLVMNYGNLNSDRMAGGYSVETFPEKTPPHAIKGLLSQGIEWVQEAEAEDLDG